MALNLWKIGGKPTSYNPLPTGQGARLDNNNSGTWVLSMRAKSASNAVLQLSDQVSTSQNFNLNNNFQTCSLTFTHFHPIILDLNNNGDIIIDSITLVQKPLSKLTVNGIDGFLSGKWSLSSNAQVVSDDTVILNAIGNTNGSQLNYMYLNPNTTYTMQFNASQSGLRFWVDFLDTNGAFITNSGSVLNASRIGLNTLTFTTPSNFAKVGLRFDNNTQGTGTYTFSNFSINLGSTFAPYSPKTGDVMRYPVAVKNLIFPDSINSPNNANRVSYSASGDYIQVTTTTGATTDNYFELKGTDAVSVYKLFRVTPNKTYTYSGVIRSDGVSAMRLRVVQFDSAGTLYSDVKTTSYFGTSDFLQSNTFTVDSRASYVLLRVQNDVATVGAVGWFKNLQLEQSTYPTTYSPYAVQANKLPQRYVPKKNLFNQASITKDSFVSTVNGNVNSQTGLFVSDFIPVQPNTNYVKTTGQSFAYYDFNKAFISGTSTNTFTTPSNAFYIRVNGNLTDVGTYQVEQNSQATQYEPYKLILPRKSTGLWLNGSGSLDCIDFTNITNSYNNLDITIDLELMDIPISYPMILGQSNMATDGWYIFRTSGNKKIGFGVFNSGTKQEMNTSADVIGRHKIRCILDYQNKTMSMYIDGVFDVQRTITDYTSNSNALRLANRIGNTGSTFYANIKVYNFSIYEYYTRQQLINVDFTNPQSVVGNTVIPSAKNLIPSFEDAGWSISSNAKVLGKDSLHLDATAVWQNSTVYIPVISGKTYLFYVPSFTGQIRLYKGKTVDGTYMLLNSSGTTVTVDDTFSGFVTINMSNNAIGSFDFYKPQLYQLTGTEGTINGNPKQINKPAKRKLYSKR